MTAPGRAGPTDTKRGTLLGTLMRANSSGPPSGSRTTTARFSDSPEMYGNGWAGSTASGVSTGKICSRKYVRSRSRSSVVQVDPAHDLDLLGGECRADVDLVKHAACRLISSARPVSDESQLLPRGAARPALAPAARSAAAASARPPGPCRTRPGCWRRWRGTSPAPAGRRRVLGQGQYPGVEVQPGQFAVEDSDRRAAVASDRPGRPAAARQR